MIFRKVRLPVLIFVIIGLIASGWGFYIHRTVHQLAIYQLPKNPGKFFYENQDYLVKESVRPDIRRNTDSTEDKKHFIDLEAFGDSAAYTLPRDPQQAWKIHKDSLLEYGYLPYHLEIMKERLTRAMADLDKDSILFYAADLGHYIGDAHVPLHTTLNYDGQLTNQKGMHALWESLVPEADLKNYTLNNRHKAKYISNLRNRIWAIIQNSHSLLPEMFEAERKVSKHFTDSTKFRMVTRGDRQLRYYTSEFIRAYGIEVRTMVNNQLLLASNNIADFWYTCWIDAGKPDLNTLMHSSGKSGKDFKSVIRSYKKERLLKDSLLVAQKFLPPAEK